MSKLKILHYSTHNEDCGIGKYQEQFLKAMEKVASGDVYNEFFPYSPNVTKKMSYEQFTAVLEQLKGALKTVDILHIQHELSFYTHDELSRIVQAAHELNKKVIITVHTAPDAQYKEPKRNGFGPHSIVAYARDQKVARAFVKTHITPMMQADLVLVHNKTTKKNLTKFGIDEERVQIVTLPVPSLSFDKKSSEIKTALHHKQGDVIMGSVGFISMTKGAMAAVKALKFLPDNYKLALIGGVHPNGDASYLDEVCDVIIKYNLKDRVYITGYIEDDDQLNALIREADVCIYPYDNKYYRYVSPAALNNALANHKPAIVYPTVPFIEINEDDTVAICKSANYYELARYVQQADREKLAKAAKRYATRYAYDSEAKKLIAIYRQLLKV